MNFIGNMITPDIELGMDHDWAFLSCTFLLFDVSDFRNKIELQGCKLTSREYDKGTIDKYNTRERNTILKYRKWYLESNTPKPIYKYTIVDQKYMSKFDDWFDVWFGTPTP